MSAEPTSSATLPASFRAVIFDYGKVLCHPPLDEHVDRIAAVFGYDHQAFWAAFERHRPGFDRGLLTDVEYYQLLAHETGTDLNAETLAQLCRWDIEMWTLLHHSMIRWTNALQTAGYKTALLSNAPVEFARHARSEFDWLKGFDVCIFSAELRLAKPDAAIFRHCLEQLGVAAREALFIDDRQDNVAAAREYGIAAIQFESVDQLATELASIGFRPLPD